MPINVALLGSGLFATQAYLPAILSNKASVTLHTIWSRSSASAEKVLLKANESGLSPRTLHGAEGLDAVLADKEVDAVMLVLPITAQPSLVIKALKAGKHVLSEKPVGKDVKTARETIEVYEKEYKGKGLIWRVAENFAHEPVLHQAAQILRDPKIGPVLYWQLRNEGTILDGASYQATEWRTIPDYQGGFLLDGGVHQTALLRTVLPNPPASILSCSSLHRTHLPPHDTVLALALPHTKLSTPPHGPATKLDTLYSHSDIPTSLGESSPQGTILLTFATPDISGEKKQSNGLVVTTTNAQICVESKGGKWVVSVAGAKGSGVEDSVKEGKSEGVEVEIGMFGRAVAAVKDGKGGDGGEKNHGEPRGAMWDLAVIEACLTSEGKTVDLERLISGK